MSTEGSDFSKKVAELQKHLSSTTDKISAQERCVPTILIAAIVTPFVVWALLHFLKPKFVQRKEGDKYVRSHTRVFCWAVVITLFIWLCLYLYTYCNGYTESLICQLS